MIFHDYLKELPLDDLKLIADTLGVRPSMISRARLLRELPIQMLHPGFISELVDALDPYETDLLLAVLVSGERGYAVDPSNSIDEKLPERLFALLAKGLIVTRRGAFQAAEYVVPEDVAAVLERRFHIEIVDRLQSSIEPNSWSDSHGLSFVRDIFSFLSWLRTEPVRLKDKEVMYKRALDKLYARLESKDRQKSASLQAYPDRLDMLVNYCCTRMLVFEDDGRLKCSAAFEHWLHLPTAEKLDDLLAYWYTRNNDRSPQTATLLSLLHRCLDVKAIDTGTFTDMVIACTPGLSRDAAVQTHNRLSVAEGLRELEWLGIVRQFGGPVDADAVAVTEPGKSVLGNYPWSEDGLWADDFLVQPTFEVIVPHTVQLAVRDELERFADLISADVTLTYAIKKDTVYRAGDAGMSGEAIIAFLERHSHKEIPQNVEYSIREWGNSYGQVYFMDVFLLRTEDAELARHIKAHGQLAGFVRGEVAPDALIVDRHRYREMMDILRNLGYMPKSQVVGAEPPRSGDPNHFGREYFADVWTRQNARQPVGQIVGIDEALPGVRLTRRLTVKNSDSRHLESADTMQHLSPKMTQELLEVAMRREQVVLVEYFTGNRSNSKIQKIRPDRIDKSRGTPHVEAFSIWEERSRSFRIANIKAIRLIDGDDS